VKLTATDGSGNSSTATATVTVIDNTNPTVITKDITIYLDANGSASITTASVDDHSYDNCSFALSLDKTSFDCSETGNNTVTLTAKDASGNETSKTAVVTVKDEIAPTVITKDITIYLDANGAASITTASVDNNSYDNCRFTLSLDKTSFNCSETGNNTVTLTAKDASGNETSKTAVVTVKDAIAPTVITKNITIYLDANGAASITTASVNDNSYDNCAFTLSLDKTSFNCSETGNNTVTLTAKDASGNETSKTAVVTVKDEIAPTVITKDITIYLDANGAASITTASVDNNSYDNCAFTLSLDKTSFDCSETGENTVTLTGKDASGNETSKTAVVTVKDEIAPTVITKDITIYLDANGAASITTASVDDNSYDNCAFTLSLDKTSFDCSEMGNNTVTLTAKDASGNTTSKTAVVTVKDAIAPTVITKNITIYLDANGAASITTASVDDNSYDNCAFTLSLDKTSFDCSETGENTVTLTGKDASGNTTSKTAVVTVKDAIAPTVITKNITIYLDANGAASITTASVDDNSFDNCSFTLALDKTSFNCSNVDDNTVTLTAKDASGNETSKTAVVTVKDAIAPTVITKDITIYLDANGAASITTASVDNNSYDNCSFGLALDKTSFTCSNVGENTVTLTATDASGNVTSKTAVVTVKDAIAPTVVTKNVTIYLDATGSASITTSDINNGSTDNCTIESYSLDKTSFNCSNTGDNTVTLTVTDVNGNSATETAVVTVKDAIAPVAKAKNISITLDNSTGSASITTSSVDNGSYDNCTFSLSLDKTSFNCSNVGDNTVTLTATDASGNTHSTTAVVTVKTTLTASAGSDVTVYWGYVPMASATLTATGNGGNGSYTYKWSTGATTKSITVSPTTTTTYTVTITDGKGCTATDEVKVTVVDVRCGNKMDKVMVCHNGHTICIAPSAVPAHLKEHADDYIGDCGSRSTTGEIAEGETGGETFIPGHAAAQITAYPNPFTTSTTIEFTMGRTQNVSLAVYDVKGALVETLFQGEAEQGVTNCYKLDATKLKADVYFARLITEREVKIVKLIIVK
jgi:transcriptional regulator